MKTKPRKISKGTVAALGAGTIALAASTYYFFGPLGKIHRTKASGWMIRMKGEIIEKIEEAGEMTEEGYNKIVDSVLSAYITAGKIAKPELQTFANNLKKQWKQILKALPK